jgi:hypothetical protein
MEATAQVDLNSIVELVDSEFATRHPELKERKINFRHEAEGAKDEKLRAEWNEMFTAEAMKAMRLANKRIADARIRFDIGA